jgi:hypothetical protein
MCTRRDPPVVGLELDAELVVDHENFSDRPCAARDHGRGLCSLRLLLGGPSEKRLKAQPLAGLFAAQNSFGLGT